MPPLWEGNGSDAPRARPRRKKKETPPQFKGIPHPDFPTKYPQASTPRRPLRWRRDVQDRISQSAAIGGSELT